MDEIQIAMTALNKYTGMKKYLGSFIERGLSQLLTDALLDTESKPNLQRLERALELGEKHCEDFVAIFEERKTRSNKNLDSEVMNLLAEVRVFEFLYNNGFDKIRKIKRQKNEKTVDFAAVRSSQLHAVEVTRLGLASSDKKKPKYIPNKANVKMVFGPDNRDAFSNLIRDAVEHEYEQIKAFCQESGENYKGIIVISVGHDYLMTAELVNNVMSMLPSSVDLVLKQEWDAMKQGQRYEYLDHLVVILGSRSTPELVHPQFDYGVNLDHQTI